MMLFKDPHLRAVSFICLFVGTWSGVAIYTMGADWWMPSLWPIIVGLILVVRRLNRRRDLDSGPEVVPAMRFEDQFQAANLNQPPERAHLPAVPPHLPGL